MGKWIEDLNLAIDMAKKSHEKSTIFFDPGLSDRSNRKIHLNIVCKWTVTAKPFFFYTCENICSPLGSTNHPDVQLIPSLGTTSCPPSSSPSSPTGPSSLRLVGWGFPGAGVRGWHELLPHLPGQADASPCQHNHACVLAPQHQCVYVRSQPGCGGTPPPPTLRHMHKHWSHPNTHRPSLVLLTH